MRSHPAPSFSVYSISWKEADAVTAFEAVQHAVARAPDGFSCRIGIDLAGRPPNVKLSVRALGQYWGPPSELAALLAPVIKAAPPHTFTIRPESYIGALKFLEDEVPVGSFTERSAYLARAATYRRSESSSRRRSGICGSGRAARIAVRSGWRCWPGRAL